MGDWRRGVGRGLAALQHHFVTEVPPIVTEGLTPLPEMGLACFCFHG